MKENRKYILILSACFLLLVAVEYFSPKPLDWRFTLAKTDKIPFGTYVVHDLLEDIFPNNSVEILHKTFYEVDNLSDEVNLVSLSSSFGSDTEDVEALLEAVEHGATAFIAASSYGSKMADTLNIETEDNVLNRGFNIENITQDTARLHFVNKALGTKEQYAYQKDAIDAHFTSFDTLNTTILAINEYKKPVLLKTKWGEGDIILCSVPAVFTNYYMLHNGNNEFVSKTLSYLPVNDFLWNEFYQTGRMEASTPLRFILSNAALKWAYYISLLSLIAFIIFEAKRRQRIIPVIPPVTNTSIEFAQTVGNLYFKNADHKNLAEKKISYFLEHIREHYYLPTNALDLDFYKKLANKSGQDMDEVKALFAHIIDIQDKKDINEMDLLRLNNKIEAFCANTK